MAHTFTEVADRLSGRGQTVADRFAEQVDRTPDNLAVVFRDQELTYRRLNVVANRLA